MIKPHIPRWLKMIAAVYATYLALVLIVATPLLNILAPKIYREQTGAELKLEKIIWINPFTLSTSIHRASSTNADQSPFWSFDEIHIDISLASVWRRHLVLDALALRGFDVQITQISPESFNYNDSFNFNESFNFSEILKYRSEHFPPQPAPVDDAPTNKSQSNGAFAIEIAQFEFTAKHLGFRAPYATEPLNASLNELRFALTDLSTVPEAITEADIKTLILSSKHVLTDIKTLRVEFLREQYPFNTALHDLKIAIPVFNNTKNSAYELSLRDDSGGHLNLKGELDLAQSSIAGHAALRTINVLPAWQFLAPKLAFDMPSADATNAPAARLDGDTDYAANWQKTQSANGLSYQLTNGKLALRNVHMQARNDSNSRVGFDALQIGNISVDSTQPRAQIGNILVDKLSVAGWNKESQVSLVDMFAFAGDDEPSDSPPWQIHVEEVAVQNSDMRWHASQLDHLPLTLAPFNAHIANVHWPDDAPVQIDIKTTVNDAAHITVNGAITSNTQSGELIADVRNLPLVWGDVFVRQQMRATITDGTLGARTKIIVDRAKPIAVHSEGAIDQFEMHPLIQQSAAAQSTKNSPTTSQTTTNQSTTDARKLVTWKKLEWRQLALDPIKQRLAIKHIIATQPWAQFRINTDGTNNFQQLLKNTDTAKTAPQKTTQQLSGSAEKPWQFAIGNIHIDRAAIDFRDASLSSAFRTNITDLSGDISNLDSSAHMSKVVLNGTVDGYAPIAIIGDINPFATQPTLNITLDMTNLDLASLTPYSGTYAGYEIDGGRLTVQMAYTLEDGRIKGTNHIVVNQMQLGKQVSGPKVQELPLRLAIYLLTDSNGVMDLGVDVTGNVDDPNFSVGSIIWKAFRNLIFKTATSPFRALGRLIGSDRDDLDRVEFEAGSAEPTAGEKEKLQSVHKALQQKTALKVAITGHVSPSRDLEALRDNTLSATLIAEGGITPTDIQQQSKNWQREVVQLFKKRFPEEKTEQLQVMQMNDAMRDNIELSSDALPELAAQRSLAVKEMLVTDLGLAPDRAFVKPVNLGADKNPGAVATMTVE